MTRWMVCAAALLVACGNPKPKADSTFTAAPDTVKPAVVSAPDTIKPVAPPTTPATSTKTKTTTTTTTTTTKTTTTGGVIRPDEVGRDSAMIPKGGLKTIKVPKDTHP